MTDDRPPIDDELVSAVLDGEATAEERALVEGSPDGRRRLAELRAVAERVADPPAGLDPVRIDALVGRALDAAGSSAPAPSPDADQLAERRARRSASAGAWRRALAYAAAAVAAVVLVGGLAVLGGRSRTDQAADSASESMVDGSGGASATSGAAESSADAAGGLDDRALVELGALPDAAAVLAGYTVLESSPGAAAGSTAPADARAAPSTTSDAAGASCPVPPVPILPGEDWRPVAVAELPSGPVVVMADAAGGPLGRVLVVDTTTCAVLAERPS